MKRAVTVTEALTLPVLNRKGLHARAAAKFVKAAGAYEAHIRVRKVDGTGDESADVTGTSILGLMMLGADMGSELHISADGAQAAQALAAIKELMDNKFGED